MPLTESELQKQAGFKVNTPSFMDYAEKVINHENTELIRQEQAPRFIVKAHKSLYLYEFQVSANHENLNIYQVYDDGATVEVLTDELQKYLLQVNKVALGFAEDTTTTTTQPAPTTKATTKAPVVTETTTKKVARKRKTTTKATTKKA